MNSELLTKQSGDVGNSHSDIRNNIPEEDMSFDADDRIEIFENPKLDSEPLDEFDLDEPLKFDRDEREKFTDKLVYDPDDRLDLYDNNLTEISDKENEQSEFGNIEHKNDSDEEYFTTRDERLKRVPVESPDRGKFTGEEGESKFIPSEETEKGRAAKEKLKEYGMDGIEYKNRIPDFSKCSEETVEIDNMTEIRFNYFDKEGNIKAGNYEQADIKCADKWNSICKDGKSDWLARDVKIYRGNNNLTWHENCDMKTCNLVPREIHDYFSHTGGCAECKKRDNAGTENIGGGFDE